MSKRDRLDNDSETDRGLKKQRTKGPDITALLALADDADRLIESLQDLKSWKDRVDNQSTSSPPPTFQDEQLAALKKVSQDVLPSLSALAEESPVTKPLQHIPLDSPWVSSEIPDSLPPLPAIKDLEIESQAFRHPAILHEGPNYERLEWLGDAYVENISSCFILATFPDLPSGRCAQIRERLICNRQLAQYFRDYDLMPRAKIPVEVRESAKTAQGRSADKDMIKVQADMFEAYVGGIITANPEFGVQVVSQWLKGVWGRTIKADVVSQEKRSTRQSHDQARLNDNKADEKKLDSTSQDQAENQKSSPMLTGHAKEKLAYAIAVPGVQIKYEDMPCKKLAHGTKLPLFAVKACLYGHGEAGLYLGTGSALGKKEAGAKAAEQALGNWKLISKFRDAKRVYLEKAGQAEDAERLMSRTRHLDERKR